MKSKNLTKETILSLGTEERNFPKFSVGDTIAISLKVVESGKERIQEFSGVFIGEKGTGITKTIRIRKMADGFGVERIFPYYSPAIEKIKIEKRGLVRRAKLYYLRDKKGKKAEIKQNLKKNI